MSDLFFPTRFAQRLRDDRRALGAVGRAGVEHCVLWTLADDVPSVALLLRLPRARTASSASTWARQ